MLAHAHLQKTKIQKTNIARQKTINAPATKADNGSIKADSRSDKAPRKSSVDVGARDGGSFARARLCDL
jgi:hypothetical protein